jgi:phospholipase C
VEAGENLLAGVYNQLRKSPRWADTLLVVNFDENGGMYDHVVPPAACAPDDLPLNNGSTIGFTQYGFRVPLLAISPYARRGYVSHEVTDGTSILRFVESKFDLPAMSHRDANAAPAYDMFDFDHPDFTVPTLPMATVDPDGLSTCLAMHPAS